MLDGELIIPIGGALSFEALQMRLHPAESRIRKLAAETPAQLILFDCLRRIGRRACCDAPLAERRAALEAFHRARSATSRIAALALHARSRDRAKAGWHKPAARSTASSPSAATSRYRPGERAMLKVKQLRTADCVVGGFRYGTESGLVGSLLLGLYDEAGQARPCRLHLGHSGRRKARR